MGLDLYITAPKYNLVQNNPEKKWHWPSISTNPNITLEIVQANPDKPWNWRALSLYLKGDLSTLYNLDKNWTISDSNPNTFMLVRDNWEIIDANLDKELNWEKISQNPNITWKIIKANLNKSWSWDWISFAPYITWEIIEANNNIPWNWDMISTNPNITWEIIQNNPDKKWNWYNISSNTMDKGKPIWIHELRLKIIKALQIQRHWRNCTCNPEYKLAHKLINNRLDRLEIVKV